MFDCVVDPLDMCRLRLNDAYFKLWKKGASPVTVLSPGWPGGAPDFEVSHDFFSGSTDDKLLVTRLI